LGRHTRIFDALRNVIAAVPGAGLAKMSRHRENSLCCCGGVGRMWQDELDGEVKMSHIKIREAALTGAEILITACPRCLIMLEDACKTAGLDASLKIMDLTEWVALGIQ